MKHDKLTRIISLIGIVAGLLVIIFGIIVMSSYSGSWSSTTTSFGADFYTYSYQATARAGNNVRELGEMMQQAFGFILIAMGLFDCCYFGLKFAAVAAKTPEAAPEAPSIAEPEQEVPAE